jgi:hypothetical protein
MKHMSSTEKLRHRGLQKRRHLLDFRRKQIRKDILLGKRKPRRELSITRVIAPNVLNFEGSAQDRQATFAFIEEVKKIPSDVKRQAVFVDLKEVKEVELSAALILASELELVCPSEVVHRVC